VCSEQVQVQVQVQEQVHQEHNLQIVELPPFVPRFRGEICDLQF
jgi:hypothetical protein